MTEQTQALDRSNLLFSRDALIRLIVPLIIEQLLLMTVGMADTVMVTTAGEATVSGVSLVDNINTLIIQIFSALSTGGAVVVAQYLGRQETHSAKTAAKQLLYAMTGISAVLMILALIFRQHILSLIFGQVEPAVMDSALVYFLLTAAAYPFMGIYNAGAALFRAMGNSKVSMINSFIINVINILVNAILIFGFGMGAAGAGIGTLVSRIAAAVIIMVMLRHPGLTVQVDDIFHFEFNGSMIRRILFIGIPTGMENGMFQAGKLMVLNLITTFGTSAVAANAIANSISGVINVPGSAMGLAIITVIGRCIGAGDTRQAVHYTKLLVGCSYLSMLIMGSALFFSADFLVTLFNLSPEAMAMASQVLKLCAIANMLFWPMAFTLPNSLRAAGDAVFTMVVSLTTMFVCRVALSYVFACSWGLGLGLLGVWLAMFCDWIVRAVCFLWRYWRGSWKKIHVI
ncbi:MATE family efflux transporter [Hydrogenoanaerobacterium saccharovorans]|uniref:Probable multidrug resistance protein NorM n=1 Tax=Hydrogenoanaerobacterium saccharovorans TaxID=474960 RepID=A0ABS2GL30_9FIRM|nr:MATE family efflux transporter [Hydrogenoanaerobacterium saccharovorans]MBM6923102.1 MATE family efflux transporter [Hydrogenoanaerobacterium saccharovorans]